MKTSLVKIPVVLVRQPIGDFYVGAMHYRDLIEISSSDMRRIESDLDRYVGIQRKLSPDRVHEINAFVKTIDATFPTSIVLSVEGSCAEYDEKTGLLHLGEGIDEDTGEAIAKEKIANILDGQHRIEGLKGLDTDRFDLPVSIFVNADMADQSYIFATVNLAQTKVNRSLVYDLLDYSRARSPQRSAHDVAVALDRSTKSPLKMMIKRLGTATRGRTGETLAQATVVGSLVPLISSKPLDDRDLLARGKKVKFVHSEYSKTPLRPMWVAEGDTDITKLFIAYFSAISEKWPRSWASRDPGDILSRTNGFRAFMRFFKNSYLHLRPEFEPGRALVSEQEFRKILDRTNLKEGDFNTVEFPPGTSGEKRLYDRLRASARI